MEGLALNTGGKKTIASKNDGTSGVTSGSQSGRKGKGLFIHGKRWYFRLVHKDSGANDIKDVKKKSRALMEDYSLNDLAKKLVICFTPLKIPGFSSPPGSGGIDPITGKKFDGYKLFAVFDSYLDLLPYFNKFKESERSFYEVIFGEFPQKPHFDIDIGKTVENKETLGRQLILALIKSIEETLESVNLKLNYERDILLYDSNAYDETGFSENKISYHLVINNFYHDNNLEAKAFYEAVLGKIPKELAQDFVDLKVYSSKQQFRLVGSQKAGSGRIKVFNEIFSILEGSGGSGGTGGTVKKITHIYSDAVSGSDSGTGVILDEENSSNNANLKLLQIIYESLITTNGTVGFRYIPSFYVEKKYNYHSVDVDITEELRDKAIDLMKEKLAKEGAPFKILSIENNAINLKRIHESMCPLCDRVHENENPVIYFSYSKILWSCRRSEKKLLLGYRQLYSYDDFVNENFNADQDWHEDQNENLNEEIIEDQPIFSLDAKSKKKQNPKVETKVVEQSLVETKMIEKKVITQPPVIEKTSPTFPLRVKPTTFVKKEKDELKIITGDEDEGNNVEEVMKNMMKYKNRKYEQKNRDVTADEVKNLNVRLDFSPSKGARGSQFIKDNIASNLNFDKPKKIIVKKAPIDRDQLLQFD